jgi:hypothetical protein
MVIDATAKFACQHEFVAMLGVPFLICHKCDLHKETLLAEALVTGTKVQTKLMFFPKAG